MNLYNTDHEMQLLSALVYEPTTFDEMPVTVDDFYDSRHAIIFKTIGQIIRDGQRPDLPLLADKGNIDPKYLAKIEPVTAANIQFYVDSVLWFSQLRKLSTLGKTIQDSIGIGTDPGEIVEFLEAALTQLSVGNTKQLAPLKDLLSTALEQIEDRYKNRGKLPGVPTGFDKLDFLTGGLQAGEFIVIGARPSIGKTAFALCMARAAAGAGYPVGFFSLEQSQSPHRLLAAESSVNIVNMRTGYMRTGDFPRLVDGCNKLANLSIWFDHSSYNLSDIRSQSRRLVRMGCKVLFIDYLTLIQYAGESIRERVTDISNSLKRLAGELNVPVVCLSQLNREAEGHRPTLANLRESGAIEQDADMVIFLHRDRSAETHETVVDVAKQRNGPVEEFVVMFKPEFTKFTDMGVM